MRSSRAALFLAGLAFLLAPVAAQPAAGTPTSGRTSSDHARLIASPKVAHAAPHSSTKDQHRPRHTSWPAVLARDIDPTVACAGAVARDRATAATIAPGLPTQARAPPGSV